VWLISLHMRDELAPRFLAGQIIRCFGNMRDAISRFTRSTKMRDGISHE
jgi:hypothetical protein